MTPDGLVAWSLWAGYLDQPSGKAMVAELERDMDVWLAALFGMQPDRLAVWMKPGRYVSGAELAAAGLAELMALESLTPAS